MRHAVSPSFWPHAETVVSTESRSIGGVCCVPLAIAPTMARKKTPAPKIASKLKRTETRCYKRPLVWIVARHARLTDRRHLRRPAK
jgi:hypothetical protein